MSVNHSAVYIVTPLLLIHLFLLPLATSFAQPPASIGMQAEQPTEIYIDDTIFDSPSMPFVEHVGTGHFQSYVTMNIPHKPVLEVCTAISRAIGRKLINRGEAHITLLTPPEYMNILQGTLTIQEIHDIAKKHGIQTASFDILCVGSGSIQSGSQKEETFFLVVQSDDLLKIREAINKAYIAKGGTLPFNPRAFYPHITIGFTKRDLHITDGVIKDQRSYDKRFSLRIGI